MNKIMEKFAKRFGWVIEVPVTQKCTHLEDEKYNGWTNRETWALNLWIENDQYLTEERDNFVSNLDINDYFFTSVEESTRNWVEGMLEDLKQAMLDDIEECKTSYGKPYKVNMLYLTLIEDIGSLYRVDYLKLGMNWIEERNN